MEVINFFDKHYKIFIAAVIGIIVISIGAIIAVPTVRENSKPTILEIGVAPTTAKIEINGQEYHNGTYDFEPGEYDVKISQDGFETKTTKINVKEHEQTLFANYIIHKEEGLKYFERSAEDIAALRLSYGDEITEVRDFLDLYDEKMEIKKLLPINASYNLKDIDETYGNYMIFIYINDGSKSSKCHHAFCLLVSGDQKNEKRVREMLKINNFNYDDYEVIYE